MPDLLETCLLVANGLGVLDRDHAKAGRLM